MGTAAQARKAQKSERKSLCGPGTTHGRFASVAEREAINKNDLFDSGRTYTMRSNTSVRCTRVRTVCARVVGIGSCKCMQRLAGISFMSVARIVRV